jgi:hypothetical protein
LKPASALRLAVQVAALAGCRIYANIWQQQADGLPAGNSVGEEAIQHYRGYALEAERKMGELLAKSERARGMDKAGHPKTDADRALPSDPRPTFAKHGVTRGGGTVSHLPGTSAATTRPCLSSSPGVLRPDAFPFSSYHPPRRVISCGSVANPHFAGRLNLAFPISAISMCRKMTKPV